MAKHVLCYLFVFFAILVVTQGCECDELYGHGLSFKGCYITKKASANRACKCTATISKTMMGREYLHCPSSEVPCKNPDIFECKNPNLGYCSCLQAIGGNCNGYTNKKGPC